MSRVVSDAVVPRASHPDPAPTGPTRARRAARAVRRSGLDRRHRWPIGAAAGATFGLLTALWTPRGPLTPFEGLATMGLGLAAGVLAGAVVRSRWAMLLVPLGFVAALELARLGLTGPSVDLPHPTSTYGLMAFIVGRGVHGLVALVPLVLGAALGASIARRTAGSRTPPDGVVGTFTLWLRRGVAALTGLALLALAMAVARPASTEPFLDEAGEPVRGSVAELSDLDVGDHELALMVRGRDVTKPVLLFLAGGPGGSELGAMRRHSRALEDDFVVVTLDQRGTGRSYGVLDPVETLTADDAVADVLAVTRHLRERFGQEKVYLVGQSWGSLLGVLAAQQRPEWFAAFVGVGQMVSPRATDLVFYRDTLAWARRTGDDALVETLQSSGPPPYRDVLDYEAALSHEQEVYPYDHAPNSEGAGQMSENLLVEEYAFLEQVHVLGGFLDTFSALYPRIQDVDLREQAPTLDVPVYLAQGRYEAPGRAVPAQEWFERLDAPVKRLQVFGTSGHRPLWEQPDEFHELMVDVVAETTP